MLELTIDFDDLYNSETNEFVERDSVTLQLEHSLLTLSKWESKFEKPFLTEDDKTPDEMLNYIMFMVDNTVLSLTEEKLVEIVWGLKETHIDQINGYINSKQTATTFYEASKSRKQSESLTSEVLYYWMVTFQIPFQCESWHLNRLLTLVRVCNVKNSKPKKMSGNEAARNRRELNAKRREQLNSSG